MLRENVGINYRPDGVGGSDGGVKTTAPQSLYAELSANVKQSEAQIVEQMAGPIELKPVVEAYLEANLGDEYQSLKQERQAIVDAQVRMDAPNVPVRVFASYDRYKEEKDYAGRDIAVYLGNDCPEELEQELRAQFDSAMVEFAKGLANDSREWFYDRRNEIADKLFDRNSNNRWNGGEYGWDSGVRIGKDTWSRELNLPFAEIWGKEYESQLLKEHPAKVRELISQKISDPETRWVIGHAMGWLRFGEYLNWRENGGMYQKISDLELWKWLDKTGRCYQGIEHGVGSYCVFPEDKLAESNAKFLADIKDESMLEGSGIDTDQHLAIRLAVQSLQTAREELSKVPKEQK